MREWICGALLLSGSFFMLVAALGLMRFPDVFTRMHAAAKASSFGSSLMLLGVAFNFTTVPVTVEIVLIIIFIFLTTPVASHMIGRAAYLLQVPLWPGTVLDELRNRYDLKGRHLQGDGGNEASRNKAEEP